MRRWFTGEVTPSYRCATNPPRSQAGMVPLSKKANQSSIIGIRCTASSTPVSEARSSTAVHPSCQIRKGLPQLGTASSYHPCSPWQPITSDGPKASLRCVARLWNSRARVAALLVRSSATGTTIPNRSNERVSILSYLPSGRGCASPVGRPVRSTGSSLVESHTQPSSRGPAKSRWVDAELRRHAAGDVGAGTAWVVILRFSHQS